MKIKCNKKDESKLKTCLKYGACPKEQDEDENYCDLECKFNKYNVEFNYLEDNKIEFLEVEKDDIKVCAYNTFYNSLGCGICDNCNNCRFYIDNINFIEE